MDQVDILVSHQERLTVRVGETYVKIDVAAWRLAREVEAIARVPVPTPNVLWHHDNVLGLSEVRGLQLARLGEPSVAPAGAWVEAGRLARKLHALPAPPWAGWDADGVADFIDGQCRWLADNSVISPAMAASARARAEPAFRPFPMVFTHGDFQPAHVFYEGDTIIGVIDWADERAGDAAWDLAVLTVRHQERATEVVRGYGRDVDMDVIAAYWAVRQIGSVRWLIQHGFNADDDIAALQAETQK